MYERHFSLRCKPFELLPNPEFLFQSSTHKRAITYLDYGIKEKIGFILLTGEIGSGKTTLIRNLIRKLSSTVKLSRINNTKVSSEQLIYMINEDFGLDVKGKSKTTLLSELNNFLIDQYSKKLQPILLVDEAQNLSPALLEEIRLLSNLETDVAKLLQIILVGQPELNNALMLPEMMQLRQRINISYHINPLTLDESIQYVKHRLRIAGNVDAINFEGSTPELLYRFSRGIPRLINILCDMTLLAAFVEGDDNAGAAIMEEVIHDLEERDRMHAPGAVEDSSSGTVNNDEVDRSLAGDIALRIIKLEESVKKSVEEMGHFAQRIRKLEDDATGIAGAGSSVEMDDLVQRVSSLEKMVAGTSVEGHSGSENGDDIGSLVRMLSTVNKKLKGFR